MTVLITGGGGFLGAWIARRLVKGGNRIRIFDVSGNRTMVTRIAGTAVANGIDWRTGDIASPTDVTAATDGCDAIVHLAGLLTPACKADPRRGTMVNLFGTLNVFDAALAHKIQKIVYTSSAAVYGPEDGTTPCPDTHYGAFKLACEGSARAYWTDHKLASIGFRPYIVYGPGREVGLTAGPSLACRAAARGEAYAIPYSGAAGLVYVDDVAAAYEAALANAPQGAGVFNLPGQTADNQQVIAEIKKCVPGARITIDGPALPFAADIGEGGLRRAFPTLPMTTLGDGIRATIAFYQAAQ